MGFRLSKLIPCFSESVSVDKRRVERSKGRSLGKGNQDSGFDTNLRVKRTLSDIFECDETETQSVAHVQDELEGSDSGIGDNNSHVSHLSSSDENQELDILLSQIPRPSSAFDENLSSEIVLNRDNTTQSYFSTEDGTEHKSENDVVIVNDEPEVGKKLAWHQSPSLSTQQLFNSTEMRFTIERTQALLSNLKNKYRKAHMNIYKRGHAYGELVILGYDMSIPVNQIITEYDEKFPGIVGIDVTIKHPYHVNEKAIKVNEIHRKINQPKIRGSDIQLIRECIRQNSSMLWKKHSNLMIITGDCLKSLKGRTIFRPCIVFYCLSKGFIPLQEDEFPRRLNCRLGSLETDVREGFFLPGPAHGLMDARNDPLCMGSNIGSPTRNASGTCGLFVDLSYRRKGFLTCCHVLFDCIQPMSFKYELVPKGVKNLVIQPGNTSFSGGEDDACGFIQTAVFSPNTEPVSLDAALVEITDRKPNSGHFVIKDKTQAWELGYSMDALPAYKSGAIRRTIIPDDFDKSLIKSGTSTGLTRSSFRLTDAEVRIFDHGVLAGIQDTEPIVMKGQYEIEPCHDLRTFFDSGDSGSAVFMKDSDGSLSCIGIAIGKTSYHTTVVTPIGAILDAFELSDDDVMKFG